ncbi:hypothetical protein GDO86_007553 [Hymenochirus boettgeri]|uniref:Uncharacterized protein n=1 Tax=Hymenochirus boettgeri TaxID=247094 RepID=A0A8T2J299_9PIPI|nr:hypothetical protein GDO86_007553 [Hymenochirus boettgeri]
MSQTSTLEEISQWSPDMCRKELPEMLPRLVSMYQNSDNWEKDIRVFNLVIEMFLPHVSLMELEQNVLSQVLPKVVKLFDSLVYEISSQASDLSSQNSDLKSSLRNILQNMVQWLVNLSACVRQVFTFEGSINLENIHSLPKSVLHVLRAAFGHCKESDSMYSGRLHLVSDLLQALFKEAVSLQKLLMELLDKINVKSMDSEKTTADMVAVLHMVLEICSVVSKMDHALHANTWKFIIKQSLKHQALVESQLRHQDIVNGLCDDILLSFQSCLQLAENIKLSGSQDSTDQRLFQKTTKLCRFFGNSLVHYTKEFMPFLSGSCVRLHRLYLQIHSQFPPSLFAYPISEEHKNEIKCVFMVVFEPLILQFFSCIPFVESVLSENLVLPAEHIFPQCQLLINILDKLPNQAEDVQMLWCHKSRFPEEIPRMGIFQAVFQNFLQCSPELTMPLSLQGVSVNGQNPNDVTFYEYVCIHLCAYIVSLPPALFPYLEHALLDAVLSCSMVTSLLAMDTWCFLARLAVVLPKISCLFSSLLADRIWLIKQHALETFAKFAEETNHEQVVPQSLTSDEMKNQVISFLNKTMFVTEIASDRFERLQKERAFLGAFFARARQKDEQENAQPLAKKARSANPIEEQCEVHLETAEKALNAVQLLMQDSKAPAWLSVKLLHIQSLLNSLQQRV